MPFSKWGEFFGSATLANAVLDRLLHHSTVISIKGPSYRLKDKKLLFESNSKEGLRIKCTFLFSQMYILIVSFTNMKHLEAMEQEPLGG